MVALAIYAPLVIFRLIGAASIQWFKKLGTLNPIWNGLCSINRILDNRVVSSWAHHRILIIENMSAQQRLQHDFRQSQRWLGLMLGVTQLSWWIRAKTH
jgi:hypothetical protein